MNKIGFIRGYCGHEMLNDYQITNMNGRLYDLVLGRFLIHYIKKANIEMKLFENRILYSFYCFEWWIDSLFHMLFRRVELWSMKKIYDLNPFGYIKKRNKSFDEYVDNVYLAANDAAGNLDYGLRIAHAQGFLSVLLGPYMMLAVSLVKYFEPSCIPNISFNIVGLVCLGLSYLVAYLLAFKNDVYKVYFKKFKKEKNSTKWHILTLCLFLGSLYSVYLSIVFWNN